MRRTSTTTSPSSTPRPAERPLPPIPSPLTVLSFLSDYGTDDEFVGVVHSVLAHGAPNARVIDLTHQIPPHDVRSGALTLWRAAPWLVPSVILAVVDPGVGTDRRAVAIQVPAAGAVFVGPDNGLLLPAALRLSGGATGAAGLLAVELPPPPPGPLGATFAGRDVFAPAAARLASGVPFAQLGHPIDPATLEGEAVHGPVREGDGGLRTEVLWIDRFGNVQLNATAADATFAGGLGAGHASFGDEDGAHPPVALHGARSYQEIPDGEVGLVTDSYGLLSLACRREPAAARLGLVAGQRVWLFHN